jgi:6-phosphogluconolactonase (cycloisomerase 2 family)
MRPGRVVLVGLLVSLVARPAAAGSILYASAATPGRIDGYCLGGDGSLASEPTFSVNTRGGLDPGNSEPRRLVVDTQVRQGVEVSVLYVAEVDRVEAYRIGRNGNIGYIGATRVLDHMRPLDLRVSDDGKLLYVTQTGYNRIVAYPIGDDGAPAKNSEGKADFTSCIQENQDSAVQHLIVSGSLLYVSASSNPGRVDVFRLNPDGSLPLVPEEFNRCRKPDPNASQPDYSSTRRALHSPKAMVLKDNVLYVSQRENNLVVAFALLPDGNFEPVRVTKNKKKHWQKPSSKTGTNVGYEPLILHGDTVLGANYGRGRIDGFHLLADGRIPSRASTQSNADVRMSPVRMTSSNRNVLYMAAGEFNRVVAYRLRADGLLIDVEPFSETGELKGSFPNDVAVAMLPDGCG